MYLKHGLRSNRFTFVTFFFLMSALLLTACGKDDDKLNKVVEEEDKTIVLSANGIGPINATTSFNMHQMTLAFNNLNVVEELNYHGGAPFPVIRISEGVKTIMTIIPDSSQQNIFSVIVEDNIVVNSLGHHLGSNYSEVYTYGQNEECQTGVDDMLGKVICYAPKTPNVLYVFNGKWNGELGKVPTADILQGWGLESIIWRPK